MWMQMRFRVAAEGEKSCSIASLIKKLKTSFFLCFCWSCFFYYREVLVIDFEILSKKYIC